MFNAAKKMLSSRSARRQRRGGQDPEENAELAAETEPIPYKVYQRVSKRGRKKHGGESSSQSMEPSRASISITEERRMPDVVTEDRRMSLSIEPTHWPEYLHQQSGGGRGDWDSQGNYSNFAAAPETNMWRGTTDWNERSQHPAPEEEGGQEEVDEEVDVGPSGRVYSRITDPIFPFMVISAPGGPENSELLRSFSDHVAYDIYMGKERPSMKFQHRLQVMRSWVADEDTLCAAAARDAGLDHLPSLMYDHVDAQLITAFVERWQPETNTFHLPDCEITITLHDVYMLMGIPIRGKAMGIAADSIEHTLVEAATIFNLPTHGPACRHSVLKQSCTEGNLPAEVVASGYMMHLLATTLFPDKSQDKVPLSYIAYVRDLDNIGQWSWGSALLGVVYRSLGECSRAGCRQMSMCYTLLLSWIYMYFPTLCVGQNAAWNECVPYANKWRPSKTRGITRNYRAELDAMKAHLINWQPYGRLDFSHSSIAPSLFHGVLTFGRHVSEPYMLDRVARQFGRVQDIPSAPIPPVKAHRTRSVKQYKAEFASGWVWNHQNFHSLSIDELGNMCIQGHECTSDYLEWYIPRTHPYVLPPDADAYRQCLYRVRGYLQPYENFEDIEAVQAREAVRRSLQYMRHF